MTTVIAHRGEWGAEVKENSHLAIHNACRRGFAVETDVRMTQDGRLVLSHDPDLKRIYQLPTLIKDYKREALGLLCPLGVALQEAISAKTKLFLHIKELAGLQAALAEVDRYAAMQQCVFFADGSNTVTLVRRCREIVATARVAVHLRSPQEYNQWGGLPVDVYWLDEELGPWITLECLQEMQVRQRMVCIVSPEILGLVQRGSDLYNKWVQWSSIAAVGICTDYPSHLKAILQRSDRRRRP
jgi:hypothetical protein